MVQVFEKFRKQVTGSANAYTTEEKKLLTSYLAGQTPLNKVHSLLPQAKKYMYSYHDNLQAIVGACKKYPELLPRLGRFLRAVQYINEETFTIMVRTLSRDMSPTDLFLASRLGPQDMLHWLCGDNVIREDTGDLLDALDAEYPGEVVAFITAQNTLDRLCPLAWLCAKQGKDLDLSGKPGLLDRLFGENEGRTIPLQFAELLFYASVLTVRRWGGGAEERFFQAVGEELPEALPMLEGDALKKVIKSEKDGAENYTNLIASALVLADGTLPRVNAVARALCAADYSGAVGVLYWAVHFKGELVNLNISSSSLSGEQQKESVVRQMKAFGGLLGRMGVDPAYPLLWAVNRLLFKRVVWREGFEELYGTDLPLLERAIPLAQPLDRLTLYRLLYERGLPMPEDAPRLAVAVLVDRVREVSEQDDVDTVAAWLLTGENTGGDLPILEGFFSLGGGGHGFGIKNLEPDTAIWLLAGLHPMAERWLGYLSAAGQQRRIMWCVYFLLEFHGCDSQQIADFLAEGIGPASAIGCLAHGEGIQVGSEFPPIIQAFRNLVAKHPEQAAAVLDNKSTEAAARLCLMETLYTTCPNFDEDYLIEKLGDRSKRIRQYAQSFLLPKKELADKVRPLLSAKKRDVREAAESLMAAYEGSGVETGDVDVVALSARAMPKAGTASIRWAFPGGTPDIRWRDSDEPAVKQVSDCYLTLILTAKSIEIPPAAAQIRPALSEGDLREVAAGLYNQWLADGAPAKQKSVLLLYGLHAGREEVLALHRQIEEWTGSSRGAIASEAVRAMALGGSDLALVTVDTIGRKIKNKQVRRVAEEAFAAAAAALGTTPEALGDRIIPTLGFDERGEKTIDYGARTFTAVLSPTLTIQLRDQAGKVIKSLPKPGAKDDEEKATAAKAEFAALKKSLKAVVTAQTQRLELALATGRRWTRDAWQKLFVENPIMHSFATGLIWGVYEGDALGESFRYMEDGSFTKVDEDEFDGLVEGVSVGLVHPLDLDEERLAQWRQQLEDYEVTQPITQLDRPVFAPTREERDAQLVNRFGGKRMLAITLNTKLLKSGWYRGSVQDAGGFFTYYREIGPVGVQLYFSGAYVSPDPDEVITVGQVGFYRAGAVKRGSYVYDDVTRSDLIPAGEVPPRMFSEMILDLTAATATASGEEENWSGKAELLFFAGK